MRKQVAILFLAMTCLCTAGCDFLTGDDPEMTEYSIQYEVVAQNGIYWITYSDTANQENNVNTSPPSPWTFEFSTTNTDFEILLYSKEMPFDGDGPTYTYISLRLFIDGKQYRRISTDQGEATISGRLKDILSEG
ncbi:hypothetical protein ACFLU6_11985 [Acidobacteriota bacterium]